MNIRLLLSLLLTSFAVAIQARPDSSLDDIYNQFDDIQDYFDQEFERIERQFEHIKQSMRKGVRAQPKENVRIAINETEDGEGAQVTLIGLDLKDKSFDASYEHDDNLLSIKTTAGDIKIQVYGKYISVGFNKQSKQESKDKEKQGASYLSLYSQTGRTISNEPKLDEASIEYDETEKALIVSLPFKRKAKTKIPVTVRKNKAEK